MSALDLTDLKLIADEVAADWGLELGPMFTLSNVSYVAPTADGRVLKVAWQQDEESLHEAEVLRLWDGDGAVRAYRADAARRAVLEERALPGTDISDLPEEEATAIAAELATRLWKPATAPFRPVLPEIDRWLRHAELEGSTIVPLARELLAEIEPTADWVVHGDFHHHNILRHGDGYAAIDPKPYLADREYDVPSFLWNPMWADLGNSKRNDRRIAAFVAAGLDERRIRAWTVIRGAYLRPQIPEQLRAFI